MRLLTSSSARMFRRCPREYMWREERELVPTAGDSRASDVGSAVHVGLETWWLALDGSDDAAIYAAARSAMVADKSFMRLTVEDQIVASAMLLGYHARWIDASDGYTVQGAEVEFRRPLRGSETHELAGKMDVIVRDTLGRLLVVEHKTTTSDISPGSLYWERLSLDSQLSTYLGHRFDGEPIVGALYDVIARPKLTRDRSTPEAQRKWTKPTRANPESRLYAGQRLEDETLESYEQRLLEDIAEHADSYYRRGPVVRLAEEAIDAANDDLLTAEHIDQCRSLGHWPKAPDACVRYGRSVCGYFALCRGVASPDDRTLYRLQRPHSELSPPKTEPPAQRAPSADIDFPF